MNILKIGFITIITAFLLMGVVVPSSVIAQTGDLDVDEETEEDATEGDEAPLIPNPLQANSLQELFDRIMNVLLIFATPVYVIMILIAGLYFLFSRGDSSKTTKGKNILKYSTIGYIIILAGRALVAIVGSIL